MKIFHLVEPAEWSAALAAGSHEPPSLRTEGFIHFSFEEQLIASANRHYADAEALFAVAFDPATFGDELVVEDTSGHGEFPHVYRAISAFEAEEIITLKRSASGWEWP